MRGKGERKRGEAKTHLINQPKKLKMKAFYKHFHEHFGINVPFPNPSNKHIFSILKIFCYFPLTIFLLPSDPVSCACYAGLQFVPCSAATPRGISRSPALCSCRWCQRLGCFREPALNVWADCVICSGLC